ncbi:MotA/TolQ/ExbB proton channel family protein [Alteromonas sp. ASW11-36]|uniref:MotA/TolQ/ExbB proton channel family protein n=1 Tax=Alteromonas arenosi TaxID=3055817 RepID=A0ABT7SUF3_9ALTE|nr:MotA/TolQ/ExbB proton channel family protein [Alteromonas sp. ASW11-36]MDM7859827.1 MotA/TolQ/ExbB proton channel family protein [Alteromonas sp. ASW11-36]
MPVFLDNLFPWLGDMLELGGDILLLIIIIAAFMWALIIERLAFFTVVLPNKQQIAKSMWRDLPEHRSWHAGQLRQLLISRLSRDMQRNLQLIRTLVKICPLLGLLGTVMGMLEIFDALAITGNNSARTTAGGVSKATISTMAGMVVAISGLMVSNYLIKKAEVVKLSFFDSFRMEERHVRLKKVVKHA